MRRGSLVWALIALGCSSSERELEVLDAAAAEPRDNESFVIIETGRDFFARNTTSAAVAAAQPAVAARPQGERGEPGKQGPPGPAGATGPTGRTGPADGTSSAEPWDAGLAEPWDAGLAEPWDAGLESLDGGSCVPASSSSTLPGVRIVFDEQPCRFTLAQARAGIRFPYQVVVDIGHSRVIPSPQNDGNCLSPDASGLSTKGIVQGNGQYYGIDRTGLCPSYPDELVLPEGTFHLNDIVLQQGTFSDVFPWNGSNWRGPSDTGAPVGPPFPEGQYTVKLLARGEVIPPGAPRDARTTFEIVSEYSIELIRDP